ncbi:unnamed protein product [Paramecium pentaurelia]|uniref:Uncharacterized protein n=1 Tax=Paramecium pentaurelia TaxID=43138 RepID=A0A8S1XKS3_9CILI|nr:unnamed protein product [Paramecium pentaurelia]
MVQAKFTQLEKMCFHSCQYCMYRLLLLNRLRFRSTRKAIYLLVRKCLNQEQNLHLKVYFDEFNAAIFIVELQTKYFCTTLNDTSENKYTFLGGNNYFKLGNQINRQIQKYQCCCFKMQEITKLCQIQCDRCRPITTATTTSAFKKKTGYEKVTIITDSEFDSYLSRCYSKYKSMHIIQRNQIIKQIIQKIIGLDTNKNTTSEQSSEDAGNTETSKCKVRSCTETLQLQPILNVPLIRNVIQIRVLDLLAQHRSCFAFKGGQAACSKFKGSLLHQIVLRRSVVIYQVNTKKNVMMVSHNLQQLMILSVSLVEFHVFIMENFVMLSMKLNRQGTIFVQNGPHKTRKVGTAKGTCVNRQFTETLNTLTFDTDYQKHHKDCYTSGYGYKSSMQNKR